jgi:hypothetical protein
MHFQTILFALATVSFAVFSAGSSLATIPAGPSTGLPATSFKQSLIDLSSLLPDGCHIESEPKEVSNKFKVYIKCNGKVGMKATINQDEMTAYIDFLRSVNIDYAIRGQGIFSRFSPLVMLEMFELIAKREGVTSVDLFDASKFCLFRTNVGNDRENPSISSTVLNTILTGEPNSYYTARGYIYKDENEQNILNAGAKEMMEVKVGDISKFRFDLSQEEVNKIKKILGQRDPDEKFCEMIRKLHASAERGNDKDRKKLVDIFNYIEWEDIPGHVTVSGLRLNGNMKKILPSRATSV